MALAIEITGSTESALIGAPSTMVTIVEGTPYTVPVGKIFVLTGLGTLSISTSAVIPTGLLADGVLQLQAGIYGPGSATVLGAPYWYPGVCGICAVPECIAYAAGVVLTVDDFAAGNNGRAYGYLVAA